ncbi:thymidine phosphorylase [Planctomycetes bacterium K23_9]|uniref:thymidine phosphorylase n=1 Tax=Stieleria marina TaxID=1930275 RepID=A0A517NX18_9BACT|nr:Pyrimidine-nucleoside phosphorylase [Planctomycetes bacterium K23_9]
MLTATVLSKKRWGQELSADEIRFLIDGFCDGSVADYQMAAFAMAVCINGMTQSETATLTHAMRDSGIQLPRSTDGPDADKQAPDKQATNRQTRPRIDKHSTGGLGDKVSLILAPLLAEVGGMVPMISGRGLGLTGGTLDKLESIPGFQTQLSIQRSTEVLQKVGAFIVGASQEIAPADRKLYSLRDVTATVDSIPLITASILSKKLAANLDALVMDVKVGRAAAMKSLPDAMKLSQSIIEVGQQAGLPTSVIISDMDQPLGKAVGNALEVIESIEVLTGGGPAEVRTLTIELAADLLMSVGLANHRPAAIERLESAIDSGRAMQRFDQMVHAQGGDLSALPPVAPAWEVRSDHDGHLSDLDCQAIGEMVVEIGGGRRKIDDTIDPTVGIMVHARIGDTLTRGQPVFSVHCPRNLAESATQRLKSAFQVADTAVPARRLIMRRLSKKDFPAEADCRLD